MMSCVDKVCAECEEHVILKGKLYCSRVIGKGVEQVEVKKETIEEIKKEIEILEYILGEESEKED